MRLLCSCTKTVEHTGGSKYLDYCLEEISGTAFYRCHLLGICFFIKKAAVSFKPRSSVSSLFSLLVTSSMIFAGYLRGLEDNVEAVLNVKQMFYLYTSNSTSPVSSNIGTTIYVSFPKGTLLKFESIVYVSFLKSKKSFSHDVTFLF